MYSSFFPTSHKCRIYASAVLTIFPATSTLAHSSASCTALKCLHVAQSRWREEQLARPVLRLRWRDLHLTQLPLETSLARPELAQEAWRHVRIRGHAVQQRQRPTAQGK